MNDGGNNVSNHPPHRLAIVVPLGMVNIEEVNVGR